MTYIDPRKIHSRQKLKEALTSLTLERGFEGIAIQTLTDHANVGYATFHRHYRSLDELLASQLKPAWETLKQRISERGTLYDESLALFRFIKEYQDLYRIHLSLPRRHPVRLPIERAAYDLLVTRWERHNDTKVPFDFSVLIVEAITGRLIHLYLDNIDKYTPEDMADMHYDTVLKASMSTLQVAPGLCPGARTHSRQRLTPGLAAQSVSQTPANRGSFFHIARQGAKRKTEPNLVVDNFDGGVKPFASQADVEAFLKTKYQDSPMLYRVMTERKRPYLPELGIPTDWKIVDPEDEGEAQ